VSIPGREISVGDIGRLQMDPRAMLEMTFSRSSGVADLEDIGPLMRGGCLDTFDGVRWTSDERPARTLLDRHDGVENGWIPLASASVPAPARAEWLAVSIRYLSGGSDSLFLPEVPVQVGGAAVAEGVLQSHDGELRGATAIAENDILLARCRILPGGLRSMRPESLHHDRRAALLEIPADHGPIVALAERTLAGSPRDRRLLRSMERLLDERCDYSTDIADPGDLPPVVAFMETSRRGHCELFASAAVVMLRSLGVPARIAVGFRGGERDPGSGAYRFRGTDAHAWVEAYLDGEGWVTFDPTPGAETAAATADEVAEEAPTMSTSLTSWLDGVFGEGGLRDALRDAWRGAARVVPSSPPSLPWLLAGLTLLLVALRLRRRRASTSVGPLPTPEPRPLPVYIEHLHEVLRGAGLPRRTGETWREWVNRAVAEGASPAESLETLVHAYECERWAGASLEDDLRRHLDALAATVSVHRPGTTRPESPTLL
jgi:hypothetical protein